MLKNNFPFLLSGIFSAEYYQREESLTWMLFSGIIKRQHIYVERYETHATKAVMVEILKKRGIASHEDDPEENTAGCFIVKNALAYIEEHYNEKLTLGLVAEKTYVSQWHLSKLLNKHEGRNFSEILNQIRVEHAKELLKEMSLRIVDISEMVGFTDVAHFSRVFKKIEGISANEYRNTKL